MADLLHMVSQRLEPIRQEIYSVDGGDDSYGLNHEAAMIAAQHGNTELARSYRFAGRNWNHPGIREHGDYYWMRGLMSSRGVPTAMYDHMHGRDSNGLYPTAEAAWNDFHQAHAAWMKSEEG